MEPVDMHRVLFRRAVIGAGALLVAGSLAWKIHEELAGADQAVEIV
jgi:hypothetical protein